MRKVGKMKLKVYFGESLSKNQKDLLVEELQKEYEGDTLQFVQLTKANINYKLSVASKDYSTLFIFLTSEDKFSVDIPESSLIYVEGVKEVVDFLNKEFDLELSVPKEIKENGVLTGIPEEEWQKAQERILFLEKSIENYKLSLEQKDNDYESTQADSENQREKLNHLKGLYDEAQERIREQNGLIATYKSAYDKLEQKMGTSSDENLEKLESENAEMNEALERASEMVDEKDAKIKELENELIQINRKALELKQENDTLSKSADSLGVASELGRMQHEKKVFDESPLGQLVKNEGISSGVVVEKKFEKYDKLKFVFSATRGYEKETYRAIQSRLPQNGYLFSLTSQSFVDYVFGVQKGLTPVGVWLSGEGELQQAVTKGTNPKQKTMKFNLVAFSGFVNPVFLMKQDWKRLLSEMNTVGGVVYCGDLESPVGQWFLSSLVGTENKVTIQVQGSLVFIRNAIQMLRVLEVPSQAEIVVFDVKNQLGVISALVKRLKSDYRNVKVFTGIEVANE